MKRTVRPRACAILRHGDRVLLSRGRQYDYWALPGGGLEAGEFSSQSVAREVEEELGVPVSPGRLLWVAENMFEDGGARVTECGFYYEICWPSAVPVQNGEFAGREAHLLFRWFDASQVAALDFRPHGLAAPLLAVMTGEMSTRLAHFTFSQH